MTLLGVVLSGLLAAGDAGPVAALEAPASLSGDLRTAWQDLFQHSNARAAAEAADRALQARPTSGPALELSYVAHWMLDDQALANHRIAARVRLGGEAAGPLLIDGWERVHTSHSEAEEVNRLAQSLLKAQDHGGGLRANLVSVAVQALRMLGDFQRAHELEVSLGRITSWQIIGPFESDQNSGFEIPYPPEKSIDLAAHYPGKSVEVGWRRWTEGDLNQRVCLDCILFPGQAAVAYLVTWVQSGTEQDVILRADANNHPKIWLNDLLAISDDTTRREGVDQYRERVHLHAGWNKLLVKVAQKDGPWFVGVRLTDASAAPVSGLVVSPDPHPYEGTVLEHPPEAVPDPFNTAVEKDPALVIPPAYLEAWRLYDQGFVRRARAAFETLHSSNPGVALFVLGAAISAESDEDRDHALSGFRDAAQLDPTFARAQVERATLYRSMGMKERSEEQARAALAINPGDALALQDLIRLRLSQQLWVAAGAYADQLERVHPGLVIVPLLRAEAAAGEHQPNEELKQYREAQHRSRSNREAVQGIFGTLRKLGRLDEARLAYADFFKNHPLYVYYPQQIAELEATAGQTAEAQRWLATVARIRPQWSAPVYWEGYLKERSGDLAGAVALYRKALALNSSDGQLRDQIDILDPTARLVDHFRVPHEEILKRAEAVRASDYPGANAVVLLDQRIDVLNPDGSARRWVHSAVKVFDQAGADRNLNFTASSTERLKLLQATTTGPDGLERETSSIDGSKIHVPAPVPGSIIDVVYSCDVAGNHTHEFNGSYVFGGDQATVEESWIILQPKDRSLRVFHRGPPPEVKSEELPGYTASIFTHRNLPRVEWERGAPAWIDFSPTTFASTFSDWDQVASVVHAVVDDQVVEDQAIRAKALELTKGLTSAEDKVAALSRFAAKDVRYNNADTAIYQWRPHPARRVLASRYGDCKDKATLFIALAREVGVRADFVVLATRHIGQVPQELAFPSFNHAIAYLPAQEGIPQGRFIDLTADEVGSRYLPFQDQGVDVMVIHPGEKGHRFMTTPLSPAEDSKTRIGSKVWIHADGSVSANIELEAHGLAAGALRPALRRPESKRNFLDFIAGRWLFQGGTLDPPGIELEGLDAREAPVKLGFSVKARDVLQRSGDALLLKPGGFPMLEGLISQAQRKLPLELEARMDDEVRREFILPDGISVGRLPEAVHLDNRFLTFDATYKRVAGDRFEVVTRYQTKNVRLAPAEFAAYREALLSVQHAADQPIVLQGTLRIPQGG